MPVSLKQEANISIGAYDADARTREAVEFVMNQVIAGKNVIFHCHAGRDRTGTVAYLLEGILGVSESDRLDEYELTSLYKISDKGKGLRNYKVANTKTEGYDSSAKKGNDLGDVNGYIYSVKGGRQEDFVNWFLKGSKNKEKDLEKINNFRRIMINGNQTNIKHAK